MKKALIYWFAFLAVLLFMTSCKSQKVLTEKEFTKEVITETIHDTVFSTEKDSSYYKALLECQNGKVVVKSVKDIKSGRKLSSPKVSIENNQLNVDCKAEAEKLHAIWKSKFIQKFKENYKPVPVNILTWWQKTQIYACRILFLAICIFIIRLLIKFYNKK